ncbi:MAG: 16S rRNA (cytosine(967)-C(5))-methyltransferase RsmB [Lachnospiraceae bacterium]|nr:16S rRNA (cytosine(967)-C(5))-methyltransferase RsmB [Lachnospiraceae bacterium]
MNSRALAAAIIDQTMEQGGKSHELLRAAFRENPGLDVRERNLITALVHGTVSRALTLDGYLDQISRTPAARLKPYLRSVLRMGLYQILYMDRIPAAAAVNESVKLVRKRFGEGLTGFANGVLRAAARKSDWTAPEGAAALSLPPDLYEYLVSLYGTAETERIGGHFLAPPTLWGRVNTSRAAAEEVVASLKSEGVTAEPSGLLPEALRLQRAKTEEAVPLEALTAVRNGWLQLQDLSSQLAVAAAAPQPGMRVLDLCAAPGGKSLHAADLMRGEGELLACDISAEKCRLIEENAARSGFSCIRPVISDALAFDPAKENAFDLVIADLPCSGLGIAGRKPEIKYRVTLSQIHDLAALQRQMLDNAVRYVKPGGTLLFSTCTLTREENTDNARRLAAEKGLRPKPVSCPPPLPGREDAPHVRRLLPGDFGGDGFFFSLFTKEKT